MTPPVSVLQRPEGGFAMLALDQRESMRDLLAHGNSDDDMRAFKATAASVLAPAASAILLDRVYGVGSTPPPWTATTPLILAADHFVQPADGPVESSVLDPLVTPYLVHAVGASAVKFLLLWRRDDDLAERTALVESFVGLARDAGVLAVLEAIVRPDEGTWQSVAQRDDAIVDAAAELAASGPDVFKAEVPGDPTDPETIEAGAKRISAVVGCPWVVLSNGVPPDAFPAAVAAACRGGASGFLAGRAVWTQSARADDPVASLATDAVRRFAAITAAVPA